MERLSDLYRAPLLQALALPAAGPLRALQGARLALTGGTGFLGEWLLGAITLLNEEGWNLRVHCTSRNPAAFLALRPWANGPAFAWCRATAAQFANLDTPGTTHVLHLAASSDAKQNFANPLDVSTTMIEGTLGCISLARRCGASLHYVSSGAVYGNRHRSDGPAREEQIERFAPMPQDPRQAYGNAKRMCEALVAAGGTPWTVSRPFAFMGAGLPLDRHFAAGNFAADAVAGRPIAIAGDGTPLRSYMHPADCVVWLLALAAAAPSGSVWNVGSDEPLSIEGLAGRIASAAGSPAPCIAQDGSSVSDPSAYWPDVSRARAFGLQVSIDVDAAIQNTLAWAASCRIAGVTA